MPKTICFTVTNDLTYDQRMHRICGSLTKDGYNVLLVGRELPASMPLQQQPFRQKRIRCFFHKGSAFYAEYNLRLFFFLLSQKMDAICSIDLDTILPGLFVSKIKGVKRVYDAHEYFTELKEVRTRPRVRKIWMAIERYAVPQFRWGYTVSEGLAEAFREKYGRSYDVIRNLPVLKPVVKKTKAGKLLLYQGAVNEARGFEWLIPAMKKIRYKLVVCGDGNFMEKLKQLIKENGVEEKVELRGMMLPQQLKEAAAEASLGIGLAESEGINQFHALPNKLLEYMHAGLPQVAMNFPEYQKINSQYRIAVLLDKLDVNEIAETVNRTMEDDALLQETQENALRAREVFCWQQEEKKLLQFYSEIFS
ncbi:MAG: glycosyltransferase [Flavisolibacter sp.]